VPTQLSSHARNCARLFCSDSATRYGKALRYLGICGHAADTAEYPES
jgi:hypothetical protein